MKRLLTLVIALGLTACVSPTPTPPTQPMAKPKPEVCQLPAKTGMCRAAFKRYFFNTKTNRCEVFTYGGCQSNGNNFTTLQACQAACQ